MTSGANRLGFLAARNVYDTPPFTHAVRTNIVLDDDLMEEALEVTGARTKKEVVHLALRELVRSRKKKNLADLVGRIRFRGFDPKSVRKLRG